MTFKVVYENATNEEDPLVREFHFAEPTELRYLGKVVSPVSRAYTVKVKRKTKVYAKAEPVSIIQQPTINLKARK